MSFWKEILIGIISSGLIVYPLILFNKYSRFWLNINVGIGKINPETLNKTGDLSFDGSRFIIHFFWSKKQFGIEDIKEISGFSDDDFSNDLSNDWIVLKFRKRTSIVFNASNEDHQQLVNNICNLMQIEVIDWKKGFWVATEDKPIIFYKKL